MGWLGNLWDKVMFDEDNLYLFKCDFEIGYYTAEGTEVLNEKGLGLEFESFSKRNSWVSDIIVPSDMEKKIGALCKKKLKEYTSKNKIRDSGKRGKIITGDYVVKTKWNPSIKKEVRKATFDEWKKWKYGK